MAQESGHTSTSSDINPNVKQPPSNGLAKLEKLSKNVSQVKCRIITVDEIVTAVNTKEKG